MMCNVYNKVKEAFQLDWDNCATYSFDDINSMIRQSNSLLQEIQSTQDDEKIFYVGYPCHLAHFCAVKGSQRTFCKC